MGSLTSTPKSISRQAVSEPVSAPSNTTEVTSTTVQTSQPSAEEAASKERKKSLLSRKRSRLGTIATSLQGVLSDVKSGARKTLLGE